MTPRWFPAGLVAVATFVSGCVVLVPVAPAGSVTLRRQPAVVVPPPIVVKPHRRVFMSPQAVTSPLRPVRCVRTMVGQCEVLP